MSAVTVSYLVGKKPCNIGKHYRYIERLLKGPR